MTKTSARDGKIPDTERQVLPVPRQIADDPGTHPGRWLQAALRFFFVVLEACPDPRGRASGCSMLSRRALLEGHQPRANGIRFRPMPYAAQLGNQGARHGNAGCQKAGSTNSHNRSPLAAERVPAQRPAVPFRYATVALPCSARIVQLCDPAEFQRVTRR